MDVVSEVISLLFLKRCTFDKCEQNFCLKYTSFVIYIISLTIITLPGDHKEVFM